MLVEPQFVSVGVNRIVNALDWSDNGLIAYAGHWIVCVYDPETAEVVGTLTGHKGQVNCVKWLPASVCPHGALLLLSGAADNIIRLWAWHGKSHSPPWQCVAELQAHRSPVTSLALHQVDGDTLLLASTSADPQLQLWHCTHNSSSNSNSGTDPQKQQLQARFGPGAWQLQPPVHVGSQIQHCVALAELPEDPGWLVMATGGTDCSIRLFVRGPAAATGARGSAGDPGTAGDQQQQQQRFVLQCQLEGHENWVRSVQFAAVAESTPGLPDRQRVSLLLASAAQDRYGRVWCITTDASRSSSDGHTPAAAAVPGSSHSSGGQPDTLRQLITRYAPRPHLCTPRSTYWGSLEALLVGHEDWLHSISWRPAPAAAAASASADSSSSSSTATASSRRDLTLLSVSQDRSMMLWSYDEPSGLWVSEAALGDAGASCLGFYGGAFGPNGNWLVAHGFTGALHLWKQQQGEQKAPVATAAAAAAGLGVGGGGSSSSSRCSWVPQHALGGHYGAVVDLAWGGDSGCLQSVSADQTARLFTGVAGHWFELARTQVHGHDFSCLAAIPTPAAGVAATAQTTTTSSSPALSPSLLYVSGSEEKVLRVFEAPQAFMNTLTAIRGNQSPAVAAAVAAALTAAQTAATAGSGNNTLDSSTAAAAAAAGGSQVAFGASVSALGLSNKALYAEDQADGSSFGEGSGGSSSGFGAEAYNEGPDFVPCASPSVVTGPPLEEHLAQNTLWPEVRKLYGHGNDVFCVCSSPNGRIIASACRAQSAGAAAVWVWEVGSWRALAQLPGHTLTVTQAEFSPDGRLLLTGSRDRSFSMWRVPEQLAGPAAAAAAGGDNSGGDAASQNGAASAAVDVTVAGLHGGGSEGGFELLMRLKAAHARIIWGVSWSHDSRLFATGSRDQTVKLWAVDSQGRPQQKPIGSLPAFLAGVTAVALAPQHVCTAAAAAAGIGADAGSLHLLAVGLEHGQVQVWSVDAPGQQQQQAGELKVQQLWASRAWEQHAAAVRRLRWAPAGVDWLCGSRAAGGGGAGGCCAHLASCGEDHSVRVYDVRL